jgi:hypothetical protein
MLKKIIKYLSAEWLLDWWPNGGTVILLRSMLVGVLIYLVSLGFRNIFDPARGWEFSLKEFHLQLAATFQWLGPIFAAVYAALYARFASQWSYLASLYNQIKAAECRKDCDVDRLAQWKAGFIEDAQELHLARKPHFAAIIRAWANNAKVAAQFEQDAAGGRSRLDKLLADAQRVWDEENAHRGGSPSTADAQTMKTQE